MSERITVRPDAAGLPAAVVPFTYMWELVEFLSYQRAAVSYQYDATHFTITFNRQDIVSAQQLMDDWAKRNAHRLQTA